MIFWILFLLVGIAAWADKPIDWDAMNDYEGPDAP